MARCSLANSYQHFVGTCPPIFRVEHFSIFNPDDGGSRFHQIIGNYQTTRYHIQEYDSLHSQSCKNLKSHILFPISGFKIFPWQKNPSTASNFDTKVCNFIYCIPEQTDKQAYLIRFSYKTDVQIMSQMLH